MPPGQSRSQSTSSPNRSISTPSSPLLSRGFASLRRSHRHTASATEQRQPVSAMVHPPTPSASTPRHGQQTGSEPVLDTNTVGGSSSNTGEGSVVHEPHIRLVPNVGMATRCFVFDVIERTLHTGVVLKLGRYSDRNACSDRLSFKSKVVSRCHAEIWQENGKIYIKDTGSSSGTFVNRARLSPANTASRPYTIQDGDLIQMGVDYKGGGQAMYRAVRMRFEVDRSSLQQTAFSRVAFRHLKHCLRTNLAPGFNTNDTTTSTSAAVKSDLENQSPISTSHEQSHAPLSRSSSSSSVASASSSVEVQECCICLYSIGPGQALFIAPCSHIYHYRCLRPLLTQNFPGFSCPLCRTYSDLDTTVNIEKEQVEQILQSDRGGHRKKSKMSTQRDTGTITAAATALLPPSSSESESTSPPHLIAETTPSTPAPAMHAPCSTAFDEMMMDLDTTTSTVNGTTTSNNNNHVTANAHTTTAAVHSVSSPSSSSDDDDHQQDYQYPHASETRSQPTTIVPGQHMTTLRQRKSTGPEGLLATTLVGSPSPFDLFIHQHAVPPPSPNVDGLVTNITTSTSSVTTTVSAALPNPTLSSTVLDASSQHHQS
ncbi:unnamed protein product [Absidia cylindrospora]